MCGRQVPLEPVAGGGGARAARGRVDRGAHPRARAELLAARDRAEDAGRDVGSVVADGIFVEGQARRGDQLARVGGARRHLGEQVECIATRALQGPRRECDQRGQRLPAEGIVRAGDEAGGDRRQLVLERRHLVARVGVAPLLAQPRALVAMRLAGAGGAGQLERRGA